MTHKTFVRLCLLPLAVVVTAFFLLPMARLVVTGASGELGLERLCRDPPEPRYRATLINTVLLAAATTAATLVICHRQRTVPAAPSVSRPRRSGRDADLPAGLSRRGGRLHDYPARRPARVDRRYHAATVRRQAGVCLFDPGPVPRLSLFLDSARDPHHHGGGGKARSALEEAARALGARPWAVHRDVILPALAPAFIASGAIAFATAMGAFGTAFTLATDIDVLPMLIYTEFTLSANIAMAAALSVGLGLVAWAILALARSFGGTTVAAAG